MVESDLGFKKRILLKANETDLVVVEEILCVPIQGLEEVLIYFQYQDEIIQTPYGSRYFSQRQLDPYEPQYFFQRQLDYHEEFKDVEGLGHVKKALEVTVAGCNNLLIIVSPDSGKTLLVHRLGMTLPQLNFEEEN